MNVQVHTVQSRKQQMDRGEGIWMRCNIGFENPSSNLGRIIDKQTNNNKWWQKT